MSMTPRKEIKGRLASFDEYTAPSEFDSYFEEEEEDFFIDDILYSKSDREKVYVTTRSSFHDEGDDFVFRVKLPGVKKEDISVERVNEQEIRIKAQKREGYRINYKPWRTLSDTMYESFDAVLDLPPGCAGIEEITMGFQDDLLELIIPKKDIEKKKAKV